MNTVQRTKGIRRAIQVSLMNRPAQKYVTAGDAACGRMMCEARRRRIPCPGDRAILAWAEFDLAREILGGYSMTRDRLPAAPGEIWNSCKTNDCFFGNAEMQICRDQGY